MYEHQDILHKLNQPLPLKEKLVSAHSAIRQLHPFIARIAVTLYDPDTRVLKTYLHSSGDDNPIEHYQALLDKAHSLKEILDKGKPRVINNMVTFENGQNEHTQRIGRQGYAASYTIPMYHDGNFFGFLFFNSYEKNVFTEVVLRDLDVYGHLISLTVLNDISVIKTMSAAIKTSNDIIHSRDPETGSHLDRMSRYSRLIATTLAEKYQLSDSYIEHVFMFAPLHDIGKISIPDEILLKPGALNENEMEIMKMHTVKGREMIDKIIGNFDLGDIKNIDILRNVALYHHEAVNGTGYPSGKSGDEIPLEAKIVAVADVFDALTSRRSYKQAWPNDDAINMLKKMSNELLDQDCVNALVGNMDEVIRIQNTFKEDWLG